MWVKGLEVKRLVGLVFSEQFVLREGSDVR